MLLTDIIRLIGEGFRLARNVTALTGGTNGVEAVNITNGGTGYSNSFAVSFTGGGGSGAAGTATAVAGVIQRVVITNIGTGYTSAPSPVFTAGSGTGGAGTVLLTALTLDAIKTVTPKVGLVVFFPVSKVVSFYQLRAGTDAEASPFIIRPDDFATTTNEKVWELQGESPLRLLIPPRALTFAATTDLNFDFAGVQTVTLTGNVTFTTSNRGAGKKLRVKILCDGTGRNFTFPGWIPVGAALPAAIAANKTALLDLDCFGANDADITAEYRVQP